MIRDINIYFVKNIKMSHGSAIIPLIMLHSYMFNNCFLKRLSPFLSKGRRLEKEGFQVVGRVTRGGEGGKGRDIGKEVTHLHTLQGSVRFLSPFTHLRLRLTHAMLTNRQTSLFIVT